jgi:predicted DNA-binding transcriptional regulator AlpA
MQLLTEQKAAETLNCTIAALRRWRRERRGPRFVKLGRLIRYNLADIEAYVEQSTHRSFSPGANSRQSLPKTNDDSL